MHSQAHPFLGWVQLLHLQSIIAPPFCLHTIHMIDSKDGNKPFLGKYVVTIEDLIYELGQFLIEGLKFLCNMGEN